MKKERQIRRDSIEAGIEAHRNATTTIAVPDGFSLDTAEEIALWNQYSHARALDSWRDIDLVLLAKMVGIEIKIRRQNEIIETEGHIIEGKQGPMLNPRVKAADLLERQHLAIVGKLSLGVSSDKARDANNTGTKTKQVERIDNMKDAGQDSKQASLLAH